MNPSPPHKTVFLNNLQVLGFNARDYATGLYEHVKFDQDMFSHANNVKAFIVTSHFLFTKVDPRRARTVFRTCWPVVEFRRQSREYVAAAFRWLEELRRDNCLMPNDLVLRKSLFEDCKGEKMETIMMALSTYVLQNEVENLYGKISSPSALPPVRLLGKNAQKYASKYIMKKELQESMRRTSMVLKHTVPELPPKRWTPIARSLILENASSSIAQEKHQKNLPETFDTVMEEPVESTSTVSNTSLAKKAYREPRPSSPKNQPRYSITSPRRLSLLPNNRNISKQYVKKPSMRPSLCTATRTINPPSASQQTKPVAQISTRSSLPASFISRYSEKGKGIEIKSVKPQANDQTVTRAIRTSATRKSIGHTPYNRRQTDPSAKSIRSYKAPALPQSPEIENMHSHRQLISPRVTADVFEPLRSIEPVDIALISEYEYSPLFQKNLSTPEEIARVKQKVDAIQERLSNQKRESLENEQQNMRSNDDAMITKSAHAEERLPASPEQARHYTSSPDRSALFTPLSARVSPMDGRYPGYSDLVVNQVIENFDDEKTPISRPPSSVEQTPRHEANEDDVVDLVDGTGLDIQLQQQRQDLKLSSPGAIADIADLDPSVEMAFDSDTAIGKWFAGNSKDEASFSFVKHFSTPETLQRTLHPRCDQYEDVYWHSDEYQFARPIARGYMRSPSRRHMPVAKDE